MDLFNNNNYNKNFTSIHCFRWIRWTIISVLLFFLVIFWMIPVGIVSSLVSLESLQEKVEFLEAGKTLKRSAINNCAVNVRTDQSAI